MNKIETTQTYTNSQPHFQDHMPLPGHLSNNLLISAHSLEPQQAHLLHAITTNPSQKTHPPPADCKTTSPLVAPPPAPLLFCSPEVTCIQSYHPYTSRSSRFLLACPPCWELALNSGAEQKLCSVFQRTPEMGCWRASLTRHSVNNSILPQYLSWCKDVCLDQSSPDGWCAICTIWSSLLPCWCWNQMNRHGLP